MSFFQVENERGDDAEFVFCYHLILCRLYPDYLGCGYSF